MTQKSNNRSESDPSIEIRESEVSFAQQLFTCSVTPMEHPIKSIVAQMKAENLSMAEFSKNPILTLLASVEIYKYENNQLPMENLIWNIIALSKGERLNEFRKNLMMKTQQFKTAKQQSIFSEPKNTVYLQKKGKTFGSTIIRKAKITARGFTETKNAKEENQKRDNKIEESKTNRKDSHQESKNAKDSKEETKNDQDKNAKNESKNDAEKNSKMNLFERQTMFFETREENKAYHKRMKNQPVFDWKHSLDWASGPGEGFKERLVFEEKETGRVRALYFESQRDAMSVYGHIQVLTLGQGDASIKQRMGRLKTLWKARQCEYFYLKNLRRFFEESLWLPQHNPNTHQFTQKVESYALTNYPNFYKSEYNMEGMLNFGSNTHITAIVPKQKTQVIQLELSTQIEFASLVDPKAFFHEVETDFSNRKAVNISSVEDEVLLPDELNLDEFYEKFQSLQANPYVHEVCDGLFYELMKGVKMLVKLKKLLLFDHSSVDWTKETLALELSIVNGNQKAKGIADLVDKFNSVNVFPFGALLKLDLNTFSHFKVVITRVSTNEKLFENVLDLSKIIRTFQIVSPVTGEAKITVNGVLVRAIFCFEVVFVPRNLELAHLLMSPELLDANFYKMGELISKCDSTDSDEEVFFNQDFVRKILKKENEENSFELRFLNHLPMSDFDEDRKECLSLISRNFSMPKELVEIYRKIEQNSFKISDFTFSVFDYFQSSIYKKEGNDSNENDSLFSKKENSTKIDSNLFKKNELRKDDFKKEDSENPFIKLFGRVTLMLTPNERLFIEKYLHLTKKFNGIAWNEKLSRFGNDPIVLNELIQSLKVIVDSKPEWTTLHKTKFQLLMLQIHFSFHNVRTPKGYNQLQNNRLFQPIIMKTFELHKDLLSLGDIFGIVINRIFRNLNLRTYSDLNHVGNLSRLTIFLKLVMTKLYPRELVLLTGSTVDIDSFVQKVVTNSFADFFDTFNFNSYCDFKASLELALFLQRDNIPTEKIITDKNLSGEFKKVEKRENNLNTKNNNFEEKSNNQKRESSLDILSEREVGGDNQKQSQSSDRFQSSIYNRLLELGIELSQLIDGLLIIVVLVDNFPIFTQSYPDQYNSDRLNNLFKSQNLHFQKNCFKILRIFGLILEHDFFGSEFREFDAKMKVEQNQKVLSFVELLRKFKGLKIDHTLVESLMRKELGSQDFALKNSKSVLKMSDIRKFNESRMPLLNETTITHAAHVRTWEVRYEQDMHQDVYFEVFDEVESAVLIEEKRPIERGSVEWSVRMDTLVHHLNSEFVDRYLHRKKLAGDFNALSLISKTEFEGLLKNHCDLDEQTSSGIFEDFCEFSSSQSVSLFSFSSFLLLILATENFALFEKMSSDLMALTTRVFFPREFSRFFNKSLETYLVNLWTFLPLNFDRFVFLSQLQTVEFGRASRVVRAVVDLSGHLVDLTELSNTHLKSYHYVHGKYALSVGEEFVKDVGRVLAANLKPSSLVVSRHSFELLLDMTHEGKHFFKKVGLRVLGKEPLRLLSNFVGVIEFDAAIDVGNLVHASTLKRSLLSLPLSHFWYSNHALTDFGKCVGRKVTFAFRTDVNFYFSVEVGFTADFLVDNNFVLEQWEFLGKNRQKVIWDNQTYSINLSFLFVFLELKFLVHFFRNKLADVLSFKDLLQFIPKNSVTSFVKTKAGKELQMDKSLMEISQFAKFLNTEDEVLHLDLFL